MQTWKWQPGVGFYVFGCQWRSRLVTLLHNKHSFFTLGRHGREVLTVVYSCVRLEQIELLHFDEVFLRLSIFLMVTREVSENRPERTKRMPG